MLKRKHAGFGLKFLVTFTSCVLISTLVFGETGKRNTVTLDTPFGTMFGIVDADPFRDTWSAETLVRDKVPVIYVKGECQVTGAGTSISEDDCTEDNDNYVLTFGDTKGYRSVTVYSTHEIRAGRYLRYNCVSQSI